MSDVVKETGPPRTLFGYFRRDNGSARNRKSFATTELDWP